MITIASPQVRVDLEPQRGAEVRFLGRPEGRNLLASYDWLTPLPASRSATYGSDALDWMSEYRGGWQELFPSGGSPCVVEGVPLPFHGEVSAAAWDVVDVSPTSVTVRCASRLPLVLERTMRVAADGEPVLFVEGRVWNESDLSLSFVWGHHPAFAVEPGTTIDLPSAPVTVSPDYVPPYLDVVTGSTGQWPNATGSEGGSVDLSVVPAHPVQRVCYAHDLPEGWAAVRSPSAGDGVAMAWDTTTFRHAWIWYEIGGREMPYYGRTSIVAIEPQTFWPADGLAAAIERGQAHHLGPNEERRSWLTMVLLESAGRVEHVGRDGAVRYA